MNTSMYDAQQGSTSGAHIDMSTASGTNNIHGRSYVHRGTDCAQRRSIFLQADPNIPGNEKIPQLHRYTAGGTIGRPAYQETNSSVSSATSTRTLPIRRSAPRGPPCRLASRMIAAPQDLANAATITIADANCMDPALLQSRTRSTCRYDPGLNGGQESIRLHSIVECKLAQRPVLIPSANPNFTSELSTSRKMLFITQPAYFIADQAVTDLDFQCQPRRTLLVAEVLLPARSHARSLRLLRCRRVSAASGCRQPGHVSHATRRS